MASGVAFGRVCYSSLQAAYDAYFQSAAPTFLSSGDVLSFQSASGVWSRVQTSASGVVSSTLAPLPNLSICDPMQGFNDGILFGSLLLGVVISGVVFGAISKAKS